MLNNSPISASRATMPRCHTHHSPHSSLLALVSSSIWLPTLRLWIFLGYQIFIYLLEQTEKERTMYLQTCKFCPGFSPWHFCTYLTAVFFETGAMSVPTKSQNPTICGWGDSFQSYLTPFLRVLSISGFLKVIHAPQKRVSSNTYPKNQLPP